MRVSNVLLGTGGESLVATEWSQWLADEWLHRGPPVCVVEGFAGVGKSTLARWLVQQTDLPAVIVEVVESGLALDNALIEAAIALDDLGFPEMAARDDGNALQGLAEVLRNPVLLVIDNFEHLLDAKTGLPSSELWQLIVKVSHQHSTSGRLLLLTSHALPEGPWQETIPVKTLASPGEDIAIEILGQLLADRHREDQVPLERRGDVVQWLGRNPRALQALVACLAEDTLEDLIDLEPDAWEMRDQLASQALVEQLELRFLSRTLDRLDASAQLLLEFLCVYRKPFARDAIDRVGPEFAQARTELMHMFILGLHNKKFSLNRIAQQLARARITTNQQRVKAAHRHAADHYSRHFFAKGGYDAFEKGADFVEARYHLLKLGRQREFEEIASSFRRSLLLLYGRATRLPQDLESRYELIPTLLAALGSEDQGYSRIRYLIARLLVDRNYPGDALLALRQVTAATQDLLEPGAWNLRQSLAWSLEGRVALRAATDQALSRLPTSTVTQICYKSAKLLAVDGLLEEALSDLEKYIVTCQSNSDVITLYQLSAAILYAQQREMEAYQKLLQYYKKYGSDNMMGKRLLEQAMCCLLTTQDTKALEDFIELISKAETQTNQAQVRLARLLLLYTRGQYADACEIERPQRPYVAFDVMIAFCYLCAGWPRDAFDMLRHIQSTTTATSWMIALIAYCNGLDSIACDVLERVTGHPIEAHELPKVILNTWAHPTDPFGVYPAFYFPKLPAELTGLDYDLFRRDVARLDVDALLVDIRFPRARSLATNVGAEHDAERSMVSDVEPGLKVTIAPSIVNVANAEGGDSMTGDRYEVGQAGAVGPGSSAHDMQFTQVWNRLSADTNLSALAAELATLRAAMRERATEPGEDLAVAEVSQAQLAASDGDGPRALSHLARAGQWALGIAGAIGTSVAAAAIKSALGL